MTGWDVGYGMWVPPWLLRADAREARRARGGRGERENGRTAHGGRTEGQKGRRREDAKTRTGEEANWDDGRTGRRGQEVCLAGTRLLLGVTPLGERVFRIQSVSRGPFFISLFSYFYFYGER
jgi:hypothetical protein